MSTIVSLVTAIFLVESEGNPHPKPGDGGRAIGPFQIHKCVIEDVNRHYKTRYVHSDMNDIHKASWVCVAYLTMWGTKKHIGREPTVQDLARIWNGGPDGWREPETLSYWNKIQIQLAYIERTNEQSTKEQTPGRPQQNHHKTILEQSSSFWNR